jgi:hypothetical protein
MGMLIVSPTYGRAGKVKTRKWLPDITLAVVESAYDEYVEKEGGNIMKLPESVLGNMSKTRNWILDNAGTEWVAQLDDDISEMGWLGNASNEGTYNRYTADTFKEFLEMNTIMAEDAGVALWGVNVQADPKFYREYTPFSFSSPVLGPFSVQKPSAGIRYDARLGLKEDYDLFLQHLHKFHKVLRINRSYYKAEHITNAGGVVSFRNSGEEERQALLLQKKWGSHIVKYDKNKDIDPKLSSPIPGV